MQVVIIALLAVFWGFLAYRSYDRGDASMAGLYLLIGIALTIYRLRTLRAATRSSGVDSTKT